MTPTLSVDADQVRLTEPVEVVAFKLLGDVGGSVSSLGAGKRTIAATEGTPFVSTRKSMYGPGGAVFPSTGASTFSEPVACPKDSERKRWVSLNACVTAPRAMRDTEAIRAASGVETEKDPLYWMTDGAEEITGR